MIAKIKLLQVKYLPGELETGILYVSKRYGVAGHLCPCGCENKIITPIDSTGWQLNIKKGKPTLYPSIGNWQLPCKSHYWIIEGDIEWSYQWTKEKILAGRNAEEMLTKLHYKNLTPKSRKWYLFKNLRKWFSLNH